MQATEYELETVEDVTDVAASLVEHKPDKLVTITDHFMTLSSTETVEKSIALDIMRLHSETVALYRQMEYEKNKEIAALKSKLTYNTLKTDFEKDLDECKSASVSINQAITNLSNVVRGLTTDVEQLRHFVEGMPMKKQKR